MKLNVTLNPTSAVTGYVMIVIFTLPDQKAVAEFNISDYAPKKGMIFIPPPNVIFSTAIAAPVLSSTPVTTPVLPASQYYGLLISKSVLGNLSDSVPLTAEILLSSLVNDSSAFGSQAPYTMAFP
jgi:hypothetical protein